MKYFTPKAILNLMYYQQWRINHGANDALAPGPLTLSKLGGPGDVIIIQTFILSKIENSLHML